VEELKSFSERWIRDEPDTDHLQVYTAEEFNRIPKHQIPFATKMILVQKGDDPDETLGFNRYNIGQLGNLDTVRECLGERLEQRQIVGS
jgi:hypothetical protein